MDLILCHQTADFDALGCAVGLTKLKAGAKLVLTGGAHPGVRNFLALHRDELALMEMRSVNLEQISSLTIVDCQRRNRLGKASQWLDLPGITAIDIYDHHLDSKSDIPATSRIIEPIGAITTLIVERLQKQLITPTPIEATVMALAIHVDTGSLTFEQTTVRDARALAWLMEMKANVKVIAQYVEPSLSPQLQSLCGQALKDLVRENIGGYELAWVVLSTENFLAGLSNLTERLIDLIEVDALFLIHQYAIQETQRNLVIIGRSHIEGTNLHQLFYPYGGGGHAQAASVNLKTIESTEEILNDLLEQFKAQIPHPPLARDLMSSPVRTIRPQTTIEQAQRILFRYGHSGLSVVDEEDKLVGIISRRDLDLALHHGFSHAPVKGYMARNLKTITPETSLPEIESLMVTYDIGRLPVLDKSQLIGIVTRTDVLRQLHQNRHHQEDLLAEKFPLTSCLLPSIRQRLSEPLWQLLDSCAKAATSRGWHLYLVGGAVRDLLLQAENEPLLLQDIDLVVDGFHRATDKGAGVELASSLQKLYPQARLSVHGEFQTAALLWHKDSDYGSLWVDIATARTEFYPYPAANPEVEASSIRQDLYRRDFTINALAIRLTSPKAGELLDFFGGMLDLRLRQIVVLHANSFIEDPTRIYRAVRFAVKLNFQLEAQTEAYIRYAIESGVYARNPQAPALSTRLRAELQSILETKYWQKSLLLLNSLAAFRCLHQDLELTELLWWQIRFVARCLPLLDRENNFPHWLIILEVLISSLSPQAREIVALNLQLPKDSLMRLQQLAEIEIKVLPNLLKSEKPSQIYQLLKPYSEPTLLLVAARNYPPIRRTIWRYLTYWSKIQAPLNGHDLKSLGYKPGPIYQQILQSLLQATLDGEISDRHEAIKFLQSSI